MADCLDVVAVGVAHEGAVVGRVVLRPDPRLMQNFRTRRGGRGEEGVDGLTVRRHEGDVGLAEAVARRLLPDPEGRAVGAIADHRTEFHDPPAAERCHNGIVEGGARGEVCALDRYVIEHGDSLPDGNDGSGGIRTAAEEKGAALILRALMLTLMRPEARSLMGER